MTTRLKVLRFDEERLHSICKVLATDSNLFYLGQSILVDLTVNGDFGEKPEEELVGKVIEVDRFQPHEFLAVGARVIQERDK